MLVYASNDVIYLPKIYSLIVEKMKKINAKFGYDFLMNECRKLLNYINLNISCNKEDVKIDKVIKGIVRLY